MYREVQCFTHGGIDYIIQNQTNILEGTDFKKFDTKSTKIQFSVNCENYLKML